MFILSIIFIILTLTIFIIIYSFMIFIYLYLLFDLSFYKYEKKHNLHKWKVGGFLVTPSECATHGTIFKILH